MEIIQMNLLSPMILFFVIGIFAVIVNSDLKVPEAFYNGYTMIILLTIGIKGGIELRNVSILPLVPIFFVAIMLSILMLFITLFFTKKIFKFSKEDSLALAAHYGSVSAVTFVAGITFLEKMNIHFENYIMVILVLMEGPAIIVAILIYYFHNNDKKEKNISNRLLFALKEAFFGKSIFLLIGGIFIGLVSHSEGLEKIKILFGDLFYGVLCIFLLHMGMVATRQIKELKGTRIFTFAFAFLLPVIGGTLGVLVGSLLNLSLGGVVLLGVLNGSASYIAAPASIKDAIPTANPAIYVTASLGLTLPFNLIVGIPYYYWLATIIS